MGNTDNRNKRILLISSRFYPPREGGELGVFEQLRYLISRGYHCTALHFRGWDRERFRNTRIFKYKQIKMIQAADEGEQCIRGIIEKENPSIIYTYSFPAPKALSIARDMGKKTILGTYSIGEIDDVYTGRYSSYDCVLPSIHRKNPASIFRSANVILTFSPWAKRAIQRHIKSANIPSIISIYPVRPIKDIVVKRHSRHYITMIQPSEAKGAFLVAALAGSMPDYPFLIAGQPTGKVKLNIQALGLLRQFKNVTLTPYQKDVRKIYEKTKILLVPSLMEETFSRVAWEAMANGIPVIGSDKGNLPHLIKGGGYVRSLKNIDGWRTAIAKLMEDDAEYRKRSRMAYQLSRQYNYKDEMKKLYYAIEHL